MSWRTGAAAALAVALLLAGCVTPGPAPGPSPATIGSTTGSSASSSASSSTPTLPSNRPSTQSPSVHLTAAGDYGSDPVRAAGVLTALGRAGQDAHLALGDLSYGEPGQEGAWCDLVTARVRAGLPFELVSGNHESDGKNGSIDAFASCLPNRLPGLVGTYGREYYVDLPRQAPVVRVLMVSPGLTFPDGDWDYSVGSPHHVWTERAIDGARAAKIPWVVVGMHKPCLSLGRYSCDIGPDLLHLLVSKRVDVVLSGHEHLYQRTAQLAEGAQCTRIAIDSFRPGCVVGRGRSLSAGAGTVFVTAGTGGAELRPVTATDPEAGYFEASAGSGTEPAAYGYLDLRATAGDLRVSLVRSADGSSGDAFVLTRRGATPSSP